MFKEVLPQVFAFNFFISLFHILLASRFNKAAHLLVDRSEAHTFTCLVHFFDFCSFITNVKGNCETLKGSEYIQNSVLKQ